MELDSSGQSSQQAVLGGQLKGLWETVIVVYKTKLNVVRRNSIYRAE